ADIDTAVQASIGGTSNTYFTYILKEDGTVSSLGYNEYGQLGNGTTNSSSTAQDVKNATDIVQVSGSQNGQFGAFVKKDGTVWTVGYNGYGQLGNGSSINKSKPVQVGGGSSNAMKLRNGAVLENDGVTVAKDRNGKDLIYNKKDELLTNLYIEEDQKFRIDSDIQVEKSFSLLKANAKVNPKDLTYTVFDERFATVEKDSNGNGIVIPKSGIYGVAIILVKDSNSGYGSILRLGIRPKDSVAMPMVSAGSAHVVALKANGTVWTWGYNVNGELGDGKNRNTNIPVQVLTGAQDSNSGYLENIIQVAAGSNHNLALDTDGNVWSWGYNYYGQLGNGTGATSLLPVKV
ncbi:MAG: RCC1 domain-containing protein, partial [Hominilimicola sp.]|uniref:RCC1 domain-containing protein n=1 Tax=Hominilimicola sp. TaxID=3073571 RepID=UPI003992CACD